MVKITPFKAYRPPKEFAAEVASPPYDVLNTKEAKELALKEGEKSFLYVNKPEIDLPEETHPYAPEVYQMGHDKLRQWITNGWLVEEDTPCLYLYSQQWGDHLQFGIVGGASVKDYGEDRIKKHENTRQDKEDDRTELTKVQKANVGPVFLMHEANDVIDDIVKDIIKEDAETSFTKTVVLEGVPMTVDHCVWVIRNPDIIKKLQEQFEMMEAVYVADGHHRSKSAFRVGSEKAEAMAAKGEAVPEDADFLHFLAVYFPMAQLKIMDYNRHVKTLNGLTPAEFMAKVEERFLVTPIEEGTDPHPTEKHVVSMRLGDKWYWIKFLAEIDETNPVNRLDCHLLTEHLISPILGIENLRVTKNVNFVGGIRGTGELERLVATSEEPSVAFCLFPVEPSDVTEIANAGELMPPKATWFEPKLASGLFVKVLGDL